MLDNLQKVNKEYLYMSRRVPLNIYKVRATCSLTCSDGLYYVSV